MTRKPDTKGTAAGADIAARDAARGYTDADLAEVMDNPEWTDEQLRTAKPFAEVFPDLAASIRHEAGRAPPRQKISLLIDAEVIARFKAGGRDWRLRINEVLKKAAGL